MGESFLFWGRGGEMGLLTYFRNDERKWNAAIAAK